MTQGNIAAALAKAQAEFPLIPRSKEVTVRTKTGGTYKFKYAPLEAIIAATRPALTKHQMALVHVTTADSVTALLIHSSGEEILATLPLAMGGTPQELGSELTYKRRYTAQCVLGVAADDDDDGNHASGNTVTAEKVKGPPGVTAEKVALRERIRNLRAELDACGDADQWKALVASKPIAEEIAKIRAIYAGAPDYWAEWAREFEAMLVYTDRGPAENDASLADEWLADINKRIDDCTNDDWRANRAAILAEIKKNKDAVFPPDLDALRAKVNIKDMAAGIKQKESA